MSFTTAIRTCFRKYATFSGVAPRSEFWWFFLFNFAGSIILLFVNVPALRTLWSLGLLVPGLAVAVRRLHDTGRSAWYLFTGFIPPWYIVLLCLKSKTENNRYLPGGGSYTVTESSLTSTSARCRVCGKLRLPGQSYCAGCGTKFED